MPKAIARARALPGGGAAKYDWNAPGNVDFTTMKYTSADSDLLQARFALIHHEKSDEN